MRPRSARRWSLRRGPRPSRREPTSARPLRVRSLLHLAVDLDVDALVEEGDHVADRLCVVLRLRIRPGDVLLSADRPVRRETLVRAPRLLRALLEQVDAHV